jgi:hypothetical protein
MKCFKTPSLTVEEQIELLQQKGLNITPENNTKHWLSNVSYFRLKHYTNKFKDFSLCSIFKSFNCYTGITIELLGLDKVPEIISKFSGRMVVPDRFHIFSGSETVHFLKTLPKIGRRFKTYHIGCL